MCRGVEGGSSQNAPVAPSTPSGACPSSGSEWGSQRLEVSHVHKVECVIPWLNDALVYFTVSLQLCQQLKDKVGDLPAPAFRVGDSKGSCNTHRVPPRA